MIHYNSALYVIGGITPIGSNKNLYKYDLKTEIWSQVNCSNTYNPRSLAGCGVFNSYLYYFPGWSDENNEIEKQIIRTNLDNECFWEELDVFSPEDFSAQAYAFSIYNDKFYTFGGRSKQDLENRIVEYNPGNPIVSRLIAPSIKTPDDILAGSLEYMAGSLYLFGGSYGDLKLNDLWKYDIFTLTWANIKYYGSFPSPRSHHASASEGDIMLIWGGKNNNEYFNDGFILDINTMTWTKITSSTLSPSARSSCCAVMKLPKIYIYGGVRNWAYSKTIWIYDIRTMDYIEGKSNNYGIEGSGQRCLLGTKNGKEVIYVIFGLAEGDEPIGYIQSYDIEKSNWDIEFIPKNLTYNRSGATIINLNRKVYIVGGHTWGYIAHKDVIKVDLDSQELEVLGQIDIRTYLTAHTYVGSKIYAFGGGDVFDYIIRFDVGTNTFFTLDVFSLCGGDCDNICSPGTYQIGLSCVFCDFGTFSSEYGVKQCTPCPKGSFGGKKGATSQRQCFPCPEGTFNDILGAKYCKSCNPNDICPVGSKEYFIYSPTSILISIQPNIFKKNTGQTNDIATTLGISIFLIGLCLFFVIFSCDKLKSCFVSLDFYSNFHNYILNVPLIKRNTTIGSISSFIFIVIALIVIAQSLVIFINDNIDETKSLVPLVILANEIDVFTANYTVEVVFVNYGGQCSNNTNCGFVQYSFQNLGYRDYSLSCYLSGHDCVIDFKCKQCDLQSNAILSFKLKEQDSYTSAIQVNFTSSSSIPDKISSVTTKCFPQNNTIFRGYEPTTFSYSLTPSLYRSKVIGEEHTETGYHVSLDSIPLAGTYYDPSHLGFTADLYLNIELKRNINGLYTEKFAIQTTFALIMTLLGSIPGIMSVIGAVMGIVENKTFHCLNLRKKRLEAGKLKIKRILNMSNFDNDEVRDCASPPNETERLIFLELKRMD